MLKDVCKTAEYCTPNSDPNGKLDSEDLMDHKTQMIEYQYWVDNDHWLAKCKKKDWNLFEL